MIRKLQRKIYYFRDNIRVEPSWSKISTYNIYFDFATFDYCRKGVNPVAFKRFNLSGLVSAFYDIFIKKTWYRNRKTNTIIKVNNNG